jgi:wobble nucleotide-excising tRNase
VVSQLPQFFVNWSDLTAAVDRYNEEVESLNQRLAERTAELKRLDINTAKREAELLKARKHRHQPEVDKLIGEFQQRSREKQRFEKEKELARKHLEAAQRSRLISFTTQVNGLLRSMEVGFSVVSLSAEMSGGIPGATFGINLDGAKLDLGVRPENNSFATVLSDGDRSALAFATFIASLREDPALGQSVVIVDDPVTSLDRERLYATVEILGEIANQCTQLMVFSHEPDFLLALVDRIPHREGHAELELCRSRRELRSWSAKEHCQSQWLQMRNRISRFVHDDSLDQTHERVRADLRKLLEDYLRFRWPEHFSLSGTLEQYVRSLERTDVLSDTRYNATDVQDLNSICRFSQREHHGNSLSGERAPEASDVRAFARKAIAWLNR